MAPLNGRVLDSAQNQVLPAGTNHCAIRLMAGETISGRMSTALHRLWRWQAMGHAIEEELGW
jgi:hypothetical protein